MATRMPAEVPQYAVLIGVFTRGRTSRTRATFFRTVLSHPQLGKPAEQIGNHTDIGQDFFQGPNTSAVGDWHGRAGQARATSAAARRPIPSTVRGCVEWPPSGRHRTASPKR